MIHNVRLPVPESIGIRMQRLLAGADWPRVARYGCCALALFVTWLFPNVHAHAEEDRLEVGAKLAPSLETHVRDGGMLMSRTAYKRGISLGAGVRYALLDWLSPQAELLYATRGSDAKLMGETIGTFYFTYLELPVLARLRFPFHGDTVRPPLSGYALLGGSVSYLLGAESVDGAGRNDLDRDDLHTFDVNLIGGLGVAWEVTPEWVVSLEARYDQGLFEPFPDAPAGSPETTNRAFLLTLGVDFTLSHGNRDGDLLADYRDRCPTTKEDVNGYRDDDGCPDAHLDTDNDGVFAENDACPNVAEDKNGFRDDDGCPDADRRDIDKDGIADVQDRCSTKPFPYNRDARHDKRGCPPDDLQYVSVEGDRIVAAPPLLFLAHKSDITLTMPAILDDVVKLLTMYYPHARVRIEGHADGDATTREKDPEKANQKESERRALAVSRYLTDKGIDPARLETKGFGGSRPISQDGSAEGRARNRRVELVIIENPLPPAPESPESP